MVIAGMRPPILACVGMRVGEEATPPLQNPTPSGGPLKSTTGYLEGRMLTMRGRAGNGRWVLCFNGKIGVQQWVSSSTGLQSNNSFTFDEVVIDGGTTSLNFTGGVIRSKGVNSTEGGQGHPSNSAHADQYPPKSYSHPLCVPLPNHLNNPTVHYPTPPFSEGPVHPTPPPGTRDDRQGMAWRWLGNHIPYTEAKLRNEQKKESRGKRIERTRKKGCQRRKKVIDGEGGTGLSWGNDTGLTTWWIRKLRRIVESKRAFTLELFGFTSCRDTCKVDRVPPFRLIHGNLAEQYPTWTLQTSMVSRSRRFLWGRTYSRKGEMVIIWKSSIVLMNLNTIAVVLNVSEIEAKVMEATSSEAWGPSGTQVRAKKRVEEARVLIDLRQLHEISAATSDSQQKSLILQVLWERFKEPPQNWRKFKVYKALNVLDYCVKNGTKRFVEDVKDNVESPTRLEPLKRFEYTEENTGKDQGINVREKSKQLIELLQSSGGSSSRLDDDDWDRPKRDTEKCGHALRSRLADKLPGGRRSLTRRRRRTTTGARFTCDFCEDLTQLQGGGSLCQQVFWRRLRTSLWRPFRVFPDSLILQGEVDLPLPGSVVPDHKPTQSRSTVESSQQNDWANFGNDPFGGQATAAAASAGGRCLDVGG
eukprot:766642-Hanusia_phi.AAC.2